MVSGLCTSNEVLPAIASRAIEGASEKLQPNVKKVVLGSPEGLSKIPRPNVKYLGSGAIRVGGAGHCRAGAAVESNTSDSKNSAREECTAGASIQHMFPFELAEQTTAEHEQM